MRTWRHTLAVGLLMLGGSATAGAQARLSGSSFVVARYKVGATASLFTAGRVGAGMVVAGAITNPATGYDAIVIGGGTRIRLASNARTGVILAGASASDGNSLRLYATPAVAFGSVLVNAIAAGYEPVSGTNRRQLSVDPVTLSVAVSGGLRLGVSGVFLATERKLPDHGIGPSAQLRVPGGSLQLEAVARSQRAGPEVRGTFSAAW